MDSALWATTLAVLLVSAAVYPIAIKIIRRGQKSRPDGIQVLSDPPDAKFEIVAVHGLGAHPEYTWTRKIPASMHPEHRPDGLHLLRDLLVCDFKDARVLNFAHNSDWLVDAPVRTAQQIANRLLEQLRANRPRDRLPIIFIGHSFGGIIIKEALCKAASELEERIKDTCGIIFLGTPHQGSEKSILAASAAFLSRFLGSSIGLPLSLTSHKPELSNLEEQFESFISKYHLPRDKVMSFYETKPTYILGWFSIGLVVARDSAKGPAISPKDIDTDHSGLNKCSGRQDQLYRELKGAIEHLRAQSLLEQGDVWIRDNHYTAERLKIERLSGDLLPLVQCYINLAIVGKSGIRSEGGKASRTGPTSLFARLQIKTPDKKI